MYDVCIVGGGAGGIFAGVLAGKEGLSVCIVERGERIGKKLLSTGNGRCNLSNVELSSDKYNTEFVRNAISLFGVDELRRELYQMGLLCCEEEGRIYPYSKSATNVLNVLRANLEKYRVNVMCDKRVDKIIKDKYYNVVCNDSVIKAKRVIVAVGSKAGNGKDSERLLEKLGHKTKEFIPSLCPLPTQDERIKGMQGVRAEVELTLLTINIPIHCERGELLFKTNALSGIVSFNLSAHLARRELEEAVVSIDFLPDYSRCEIEKMMENPIMADNGILHKAIIQAVGRDSLKDFRVKVQRNKDFSFAQVCSGGYICEQFSAKSMESNLHKGIFAIGEALDVDGECGGYNLHWAFASAYSAVQAIVRERKDVL